MTGLEARRSGAVKFEVAPWTGPCSCMGELRISSLDGMGRLLIRKYCKQRHHRSRINKDEPILSPNLTCGSGLRPNLRPKRIDFIYDQFLHSFDCIFFLKPEVKFLFKMTGYPIS
jgi:hypothetical protein